MDKVGSGISNRLTSREQNIDHKRIMEDYARRMEHRQTIGTHTLGEEYKTKK